MIDKTQDQWFFNLRKALIFSFAVGGAEVVINLLFWQDAMTARNLGQLFVPIWILVIALFGALPFALVSKLRSGNSLYREFFSLVAVSMSLAGIGTELHEVLVALFGPGYLPEFVAALIYNSVGAFFWFYLGKSLFFVQREKLLRRTVVTIGLLIGLMSIYSVKTGWEKPSGFKMQFVASSVPRFTFRNGETTHEALHLALAQSFGKVRKVPKRGLAQDAAQDH